MQREQLRPQSLKKSSTSTPGVSARWYWLNNEGAWVEFEKSTSEYLEKQYQEIPSHQTSDKRLRLDAERFVDVNFATDLDIKKQFKGLDDEEGLVGIQRRYDDEMKRRAIKREVSSFSSSSALPNLAAANSLSLKSDGSESLFRGEHLLLLGRLVLRKDLQELIVKHGGSWTKLKLSTVTAAVCHDQDVQVEIDTLRKYVSISERWIYESVKQTKKLPKEPFLIALPETKGEVEHSAQKKKRKVEETDESKQTAEPLDFMGFCSSYCSLRILSRDGNAFEGEFIKEGIKRLSFHSAALRYESKYDDKLQMYIGRILRRKSDAEGETSDSEEHFEVVGNFQLRCASAASPGL